ncbi:MAG: EAL domain-containing protein [Lachnospiraceae bacterium]|nr:EAL domain-containing protein [Lachnospiraceae bacterium]
MSDSCGVCRELTNIIDEINIHDCDPHSVHTKIVSILKNYAHTLRLGKVEVVEYITPNLFFPLGDKRTFKSEYAHVDDYDDNAIIFEMDELIHTVCTFKIQPEAGYVWNESEKNAVMRVSKLIAIIISRCEYLSYLEKVEYLDTMTGLINSGGLRRIGISLQDKQLIGNYVGAWVNLKSFKYTNKKFGPKVGDQIIKYFGSVCRKLVDNLEGDNYVSRFGGDNYFFLVLRENASKVLEGIKNIEYTLEIFDEQTIIKVPARAGLFDNFNGATMAEIIAGTNFALDTARAKNLDVVWFDKEMGEKIMHSKRMVMEFPGAMKKGDIVPYYQPRVSSDERELCGAEALVRWKQGDKVLPPAAFLPAIEREGSVRELDLYMLECVCRDLRDWLDRGIEPVRTSVNYSRVNLSNPKLVDQTIDIIKKYNIDSRYIEIEITETADMEDGDVLAEFMSNMRDNNVKISMDDFGTGYSSLYLFKDRTFDIVKIDKSFIDNITKDLPKDKIVLNNMIRMLKELDVEITAEGVESEEQIDFLKDCGCQVIQGYIFDHPLPHDEFEQRLINRKY